MGFLSSRNTIIVLTAITAVVHLVVLNMMNGFSALFTLNGIGYLVLLWALFWPPTFLTGQSTLVHYAFIAYTVVTIVLFFVMNAEFGYGTLGLITKADEALLVIGLFLHMRSK